MGRRTPKPDKFYCPKCGKKELTRSWDKNRTWKCQYNAPSTRPWRSGAKVVAGPACGLVISHPDRHAKISDYHSVLDLIVRDGEAIKHHLLENNANVRKRGLEIMYAGELLDLVRLRDNEGVGAYIYFKAHWDGTVGGVPCQLTGGASRHIKFRDHTVESLSRVYRFCLWAKKETYHPQRGAPFKGKLTAKMRIAIVEWAAALDRAWPQLAAKATSEHDRWVSESKALQAELRFEGKGPCVQVKLYNGETKTVSIDVHGAITPDQARAVAAIFADAAVTS